MLLHPEQPELLPAKLTAVAVGSTLQGGFPGFANDVTFTAVW